MRKVKIGLWICILLLLNPILGENKVNYNIKRCSDCDNEVNLYNDRFLEDIFSGGNSFIKSSFPPYFLARVFTEKLPKKFDWRNIYGINFITPVKDQGKCGACTAFAYVALCEAVLNIKAGQPLKDNDLSEAWVMFTLGLGDCRFRGVPKELYNGIMNFGIVDEECFPYDGAINGTNLPRFGFCPDFYKRIKRFTPGMNIFSNLGGKRLHAQMIKYWLVNYGPVVSVNMLVYPSFLNYTGGIYEHQPGEHVYLKMPLHSVLIVGYDDNENCWICKNSFGRNWGENGYFRIKYGECMIEQVVAVIYPFYPPKFESPHEGSIYIGGLEIPMMTLFLSLFILGEPMVIPIIIGKIKIKPHLMNEKSINKVEFYIDDELRFVDEDTPFEWIWNEKIVGIHEIKILAYNNSGKIEVVKWLNVFIFNV